MAIRSRVRVSIGPRLFRQAMSDVVSPLDAMFFAGEMNDEHH